MRERLLIVGVIVAVVYLLWDFVFFQSMAKEMQVLVARERVAKQAVQTTQAEITVLQSIAKKDPNIALRQEVNELRNKLSTLDQQLDTLAVGLVPAQQLPKIMHSVLRATGKLKLENLATLPPEELSLSADLKKADTSADAAKDQPNQPTGADESLQRDARIFKHSVVLNLSGDFTGAVQYLRTLEQSEWRFYWESLKYQVTNYPEAKIQLRVFTLSSQRGVLDGA